MMERQQEIELERFGAFEVGKRMLTLAHHHHHNNRILNAGRGNPNWINTKARLAMARLIEFGVSESNRTICSGDMGGYVEEEKIGERFRQFVDRYSLFDADYVGYSYEHSAGSVRIGAYRRRRQIQDVPQDNVALHTVCHGALPYNSVYRQYQQL